MTAQRIPAIFVSYDRPVTGKTARWLRDELDAALTTVSRLSQEQREIFWEAVGRPGDRQSVGGVGILKVKLSRAQGTWEPADEGVSCLILPARTNQHFVGADLVDLVAYHPQSARSFRRLGNAAVLGEWHLDFPAIFDEPLTIYPDPLAWARDNGRGIVILDWSRVRETLGHVNKLYAPNVSFAKELKRRLVPPKVTVPEIFIPDGAAQ